MRGDAYVFFGLGQREQETYQRCPGDGPDQLNALIRSTYKQVMGNPHLMEFERAISAESKFIDGYLSTRELCVPLAYQLNTSVVSLKQMHYPSSS